jgi:RNA polymerase sigma-70 factor (ECF subfamily)
MVQIVLVELVIMSPKPNGSLYTDTDVIKHVNALYSYALVLTRGRSEAEDFVQETYIRAIGAMERPRTDSKCKKLDVHDHSKHLA